MWLKVGVWMCMCVCALIAIVRSAVYPRFSFSKVPTYAQFCNATGVFNAETVEILTRYSFVVIEKGQGENGTVPGWYAEDYMVASAMDLKAADPDLHVVFYWNSVLDWPMYRLHAEFVEHPAWWMTNVSGFTVYMNGDESFNGHTHMLVFDLGQRDCARFWANACLNLTGTPYFDGCNSDRVWQMDISGEKALLNFTSQAFYLNRKLQTMIDIQKTLNETGNGVHFVNYGQLIPGVSGVTLEGFNANEEDLMALIYTVNAYPAAPGTLAAKVHGGYKNPCSNPKQFTNILATFLVAFDRNCWFTCSKHYFVSESDNAGWHDEYNRTLGQPSGNAMKLNDTYVRLFESDTVVLFNTSNNTGTIYWADEEGGEGGPGQGPLIPKDIRLFIANALAWGKDAVEYAMERKKGNEYPFFTKYQRETYL